VKVLHIFTQFPNPYQPYNQKLIERQKNAGINCLIFSFSSNKKNRLRTLSFILNGLFHFSLMRRFKRKTNRTILQAIIIIGVSSKIIKSKADLIHVHHSQCLTLDYQILFSMLNIPCIVSLRGSDALVAPLLSPQSLTSFRNVLQFSAGIHTVSKHLERIAKIYGASPNKIRTITRTPDEITPMQRNLDYSIGPFMITSIGRLHWTKGFTYLIQCVGQLRKDGVDLTLHLIGDGNSDLKSEINFWIDYLDLKDYVILHGYQSSDAINELLAQTHVYVQPSVTEGIPNTLIKAIANRIPVVASDTGGIPEIVGENQGILVNPGNVDMLVHAIKRILLNEEFRSELYKNPHNLLFDPTQEINSYKKFYEFILTDIKNI
jgi:glycosyltransferase involved in cell wall biosynthesis